MVQAAQGVHRKLSQYLRRDFGRPSAFDFCFDFGPMPSSCATEMFRFVQALPQAREAAFPARTPRAGRHASGFARSENWTASTVENRSPQPMHSRLRRMPSSLARLSVTLESRKWQKGNARLT